MGIVYSMRSSPAREGCMCTTGRSLRAPYETGSAAFAGSAAAAAVWSLCCFDVSGL